MLNQFQHITIGIIGLGSIGLRHANELINLGVKNIYALRTNKGSKEIPETIINHIINIYDEKDFLELAIDGYIISNPTSLHIEAINLVSKQNKPIFIEKPLCENLIDINKLDNISSELIQIGFCLRFNSLFKKVKTLLDDNAIGDVYHSRINVGQYLPSWHPYTDYRTEYFSQKKLGGGALRTLSHEIDLGFYFFGKPTKAFALSGQISNLEIDVDDYALLLLSYHNKHTSRIEIDFLNKKKERKGIIFGTKGDLHYNLFDKTIFIYDINGEEIKNITIQDNNMYNEQMQSFLTLITSNGKTKEGSSWDENIHIMKIIENEKPI